MSKDKGKSDEMIFPMLILLGAVIVIWKLYMIFLHTLIPLVVRFYFTHYYLSIFLITSLVTLTLLGIAYGVSKLFEATKPKKVEIKKDPDLLLGYTIPGRKPVMLSVTQRTLHGTAIGTTGFGKTESGVFPMVVDDIKQGRGCLVMDGKSDRSFLNKLYAYTAKYNRTKDFRVFSLFEPAISNTYNPLIGGPAEEISERVFNSFDFENEYYEDLQRDWFAHVLRIFEKTGQKPTFLKISQSLSDPRIVRALAKRSGDEDLDFWAKAFCERPALDVRKEINGLLNKVNRFAYGQFAPQYNSDNPTISIQQAMTENLIVYFQLPAMQFADLGRSTGRILVQDLMSQIANRHKGSSDGRRFFGVYLDDFAEYLHENFVTVLNKSRSANVGIMFSHQAKGDIDALGPAVSNAIVTNTNTKIIMRSTEPDTAEYYARMIGTKKTEKTTERRRATMFSTENTGDMSVRDAEEFLFHPREIKNELRIGEGLLMTPDQPTMKVKFNMLPELTPIPVPLVEKIQPLGMDKKDLNLEDASEKKKQSAQNSRQPNAPPTKSVLSDLNSNNLQGGHDASQ